LKLWDEFPINCDWTWKEIFFGRQIPTVVEYYFNRLDDVSKDIGSRRDKFFNMTPSPVCLAWMRVKNDKNDEEIKLC